MRGDRVIRPGRRKSRVSTRPSVAEAQYPITDYIVPPSDSKGRSVSVSLTLPPVMRRVSSIILGKRTLPFETEQDVLRWCIHHGLKLLVERADDKEVTSSWSFVESLTAQMADELEHLYYEDHLKLIIGAIKRLAAAGHVDKALDRAEKVWRYSDRIDDPHWRKQYRDQAKRALDRLRRSNGRDSNGDRGSDNE